MRRLRRHRLRFALTFVSLGLTTTVAIAMCMTLWADVEAGSVQQAQEYVDGEAWSVTRWDRPGASRIKSVRMSGADWSPQQVAGPPNTPTVGDQTTAWASSSQDASSEWLILEYAKAVIPRRIDVYESNAPGALTKVTVFDERGEEVEAWSGTDPTPPQVWANMPTPVSAIPVTLNVPTRRVKLYLASDKVPGWNEIDAVGLIDDKGMTQWARRVTASSTYGRTTSGISGTGGNPALLIPYWARRIERRSEDMANGVINREEQQADARGWPMLALWSESDPSTIGASAGAATLSGRTAGSLSGFSGVVTLSGGTQVGGPAPVPYRPIWAGLIGDTLFFGLVWFALWATLVIPRRFVREVGRMRRGGCVRCGYDLGYDFVRGCPECGWRREGESAPSRVMVSEPTNGERR